MQQPTITLHPLHTADGSAIYQTPNHTILSSVNYPLEVTYRSKERPEDTYIDVNVRPHNAVAGVKERHVETIIKRVLQSLVLGGETPRSMLQVTVQVMDVRMDESLPGGVKGGGQGEGYLGLLVGCVNAVVAGCLDGAVQMSGFAGGVVVAVEGSTGDLVVWPDERVIKRARSVHAFVYGRDGECLVMESEGVFDLEEWEGVEKVARRVVVGVDGEGNSNDEDSDVDMDPGKSEMGESVLAIMRRAVEAKVEQEGRWRES